MVETIGFEEETSDLDGHRSACTWGTGVSGCLIWFWGPYSYSPPRMCSYLVNLPHVLDTVVELGCASQCCRPSVLQHKARLKPSSSPKVLPVFLGDSTHPMPCWHGGVKAWSPCLSLAQLWRAIPVLEPPPPHFVLTRWGLCCNCIVVDLLPLPGPAPLMSHRLCLKACRSLPQSQQKQML